MEEGGEGGRGEGKEEEEEGGGRREEEEEGEGRAEEEDGRREEEEEGGGVKSFVTCIMLTVRPLGSLACSCTHQKNLEHVIATGLCMNLQAVQY